MSDIQLYLLEVDRNKAEASRIAQGAAQRSLLLQSRYCHGDLPFNRYQRAKTKIARID